MPETATQVELSQEEIREAEERAMPRAAVVFETIRREGEGELNRTISALTERPRLAGNSAGGVTFVALLNFGQIAGDSGPDERKNKPG